MELLLSKGSLHRCAQKLILCTPAFEGRKCVMQLIGKETGEVLSSLSLLDPGYRVRLKESRRAGWHVKCWQDDFPLADQTVQNFLFCAPYWLACSS